MSRESSEEQFIWNSRFEQQAPGLKPEAPQKGTNCVDIQWNIWAQVLTASITQFDQTRTD